jgi:hypothetical protein
MSNEIKHANTTGHGDYERRDIGVGGVLYFIAGLVAAGLLVHFVVSGFYSYLEKRSNAEQTPISPLVEKAPTDTRHVSRDYPQTVFPSPRLEEDERGQLNGIRIEEENTLNSYGWVDQKAGTVRIPIDRAMDLVAQRGLPVRSQGASETASSEQAPLSSKKGSKK